MRLVIALGGNALARRGERLEAATQRERVRLAFETLAPIFGKHEVVITHGNGPQVGLLALQAQAYREVETYPLDVLSAESQGMIGCWMLQELNGLMPDREVAALLTQVEVDARDPALRQPSKPIGPMYTEAEARQRAQALRWSIAADGNGFRRVVPSPRPLRIREITAVKRLLDAGAIVICGGGGGIPIVVEDDGRIRGLEAVIDKDRTAALVAAEIGADRLLILTDVDAVVEDWPQPARRKIRATSPKILSEMKFEAGSMGPKVEAACEFATHTGGLASIGALTDAARILEGQAGTTVSRAFTSLDYHRN
jgi:carbamate kinase